MLASKHPHKTQVMPQILAVGVSSRDPGNLGQALRQEGVCREAVDFDRQLELLGPQHFNL